MENVLVITEYLFGRGTASAEYIKAGCACAKTVMSKCQWENWQA